MEVFAVYWIEEKEKLSEKWFKLYKNAYEFFSINL